MAIETYEFGTMNQLRFFLLGGIRGGKPVTPQNTKGVLLGLNGLTLIFSSPNGTVTFSDPTGAGLTLDNVITQINAVHALSGIGVNWVDQCMGLFLSDKSAGVTLSKSGTANTYFGFSTDKNTVGTLINGPKANTLPMLIWSNSKAPLDGYYIHVEVS